MVDLPKTSDAVVIGGGVVGLSALYYLTSKGLTDVLLLERATLGSGSTGAAAGGVRAQFSDELNIRISLESIRRLERFDEEIGAELDLRQWGYLFLLESDAVPEFRRSVALQQSLGVPSRLISPSDACEIVPGLNVDGIAAATFCDIDGYVTPASVCDGYAAAARRGGATIVQSCEVLSILAQRGDIVAVDTAYGRVFTDTVILAAGVWSPELAGPLGLDLPVIAERRHVFFTIGEDTLPRELPLTIDFASGFYFHREGNGLLLGGRDHTIEELAPKAVRRLPELEDIEIGGGWHGFYEMSPDHNAVVGEAQSPRGLFYATGFSGHGFQQAPVIGEYLADLALGSDPRFDLRPLGADRFAERLLRSEANVV